MTTASDPAAGPFCWVFFRTWAVFIGPVDPWRDVCAGGSWLRSEVNSELNFPPKLRGARSRLYRRRFLQVNTRWKALAEIYTMHSFAPFSNLNFFVKNRHFFCEWINEYSLIHSQTLRMLRFLARIFDEFFSGFRAKFQKIVTCAAFCNQICENKSEICRKFWILWKKFTIISEIFTSLLAA